MPSSYESICHFVKISSKWLPKSFIQIFKEYLRVKLQAPMLRYGIFSCVRKFLPFSQKRGNISDFMLLSLQCDLLVGFGGIRSVRWTFAL